MCSFLISRLSFHYYENMMRNIREIFRPPKKQVELWPEIYVDPAPAV